MRQNGISGALVFHAGAGKTPNAMLFMSPEWREFVRFAVEAATKRNITIGLNPCGGWNAGEPWVKEDDAVKVLAHATAKVHGPKPFTGPLPVPAADPESADPTFHDIAVLACRQPELLA